MYAEKREVRVYLSWLLFPSDPRKYLLRYVCTESYHGNHNCKCVSNAKPINSTIITSAFYQQDWTFVFSKKGEGWRTQELSSQEKFFFEHIKQQYQRSHATLFFSWSQSLLEFSLASQLPAITERLNELLWVGVKIYDNGMYQWKEEIIAHTHGRGWLLDRNKSSLFALWESSKKSRL